MPPLFKVDQVLRGHKSIYITVKEVHRALDEAAVYVASVRGHWCLQNEADILGRYQSKTPFLRPIIDEVISPADPPSIILRHLDSELLTESTNKRPTRPETKQVARCILEALLVLHRDGMRFLETQLGNCGGAVSKDSKFAEGNLIGGAFTHLPTDVWSFGNAILSLVHGGDFHYFDPGRQGVKLEDREYDLIVMQRMYHSSGPFQKSVAEILNLVALELVIFFSGQRIPRKPLQRWSTKEIPSADNKFIRRILKLDPRERPMVEEIFEDEWFMEESDDTREPIPKETSKPEDEAGS
ncbi:hypothetical protein COCMIDRAFT_38429 [Bipolaris oryzae ATCC 44560]|uniref:Protein kinase domain-containing protein n=1 Tax=Bipolaris oryzae ATCC 44560 TaxID=930090 RepID=W6ZJ49_COCMI|nr:uncharacterized protein COCMIDRAFT_38429 [Bipolaris oryzae ATCC 44560]EUC43626.1 hypothetical protein COCMIDRAFT_38429 [Bipolaris oryzae ATCC 44560]